MHHADTDPFSAGGTTVETHTPAQAAGRHRPSPRCPRAGTAVSKRRTRQIFTAPRNLL